MNDTSTGSNYFFPFAEYGKIFLYKDNSTDFKILDQSTEGLAKRFYDFYSNKIANYAVEKELPFGIRMPGYGNFTMALIEYPYQSGNYLFLQIQQRKEQEHLEATGVPTGNLNNRSFNQARISVVSSEQIRNLFQRRIGLYSSLLVRSQGVPRLKDYWIYDETGRSILPRVGEQAVVCSPMDEKRLDRELLAGLTNLLHQYFGPQAHADAPAGRSVPAVVLVIPRLDVETRLNLMQAAQFLLLPATGVITFTLDYISEPSFQFYFCTEDPPAWMFTAPIFFSEHDLQVYSQDSDGYYQTARNFGTDQLYEPHVVEYLKRSFSIKVAVRIAQLLNSETEPLDSDFVDLLIMNLGKFRSTDVSSLIRRVINDPLMIDSILRKNSSNSETNTRLGLYRLILSFVLEQSSGDLPNFYHYYRQISEEDRHVSGLRVLFKKAVLTSASTCLDKVTSNEQSDLYRELILLGQDPKAVLVFSDGIPVLKAVFCRPGADLCQAIAHLVNRNWNNHLTEVLGSVIIHQLDVWTVEQQQKLAKETGLKFPKTFVPNVTFFLRDAAEQEKFKRKSFDERSTFLRQMLDRGPGFTGTLLGLFDADSRKKLCEICLEVCSHPSLMTLRFASWWLAEIAGGGDETFKTGFSHLTTQYKTEPLFDLETQDDQIIDFLLRGRANSSIKSLFESCCSAKLEKQYYIILDTWLEQQLVIPIEDIVGLVNKLNSTNGFLARMVTDYSQSEQTNEICKLPAEEALKWLKQTVKNKQRQAYNNKNGEDQLYPLMCKIQKPNKEFVYYALFDDPLACPANPSWSDYVSNVSALYETFNQYAGGEELAGTYVKLVKCYKCPSGQESLHRYGLRRLAERSCKENSKDLVPMEDRELRLILTYALGDGLDKKIQELAGQVLIENRNDFLQRISNLKDDEVYSLHLFYERKGLEIELFKALTDEGWRRRGIKPPAPIEQNVSMPSSGLQQYRSTLVVTKPTESEFEYQIPYSSNQGLPRNSKGGWISILIIFFLIVVIIIAITRYFFPDLFHFLLRLLRHAR